MVASSGQGGSTGSTTGSGAGGNGACDATVACLLAVPGCCGTCGKPSLADVTPIAANQAKAFFDATCPDPEGTPCPGCASFPNGNLYAYCEAGQCVESDVSVDDLGACAQPSECRLRWGSECCEGCNGSWEPNFGGDLIAINSAKVSVLASRVCVGDVGCPECAPTYPPGATADCVAGRCVVAGLSP